MLTASTAVNIGRKFAPPAKSRPLKRIGPGNNPHVFSVPRWVGGNAMGLALWMIGTLVAAVVVANMPSGRPETPRH
jgi:hypothetical protein